MKFEKVSKDKIKITLNYEDLIENNIDYHSFMSDSNETHSLFLSVLNKAERDYGFSTENYSLRVETLALDNGSFILTITRSQSPDIAKAKKKLKVSRKAQSTSSESLIYRFNSFEDFCNFAGFIFTNSAMTSGKISKSNTLYLYNNTYYLVFEKINAKFPYLKVLYSTITEFGTYIKYSDILVSKIQESGKVIASKNALKTAKKYFA